MTGNIGLVDDLPCRRTMLVRMIWDCRGVRGDQHSWSVIPMKDCGPGSSWEPGIEFPVKVAVVDDLDAVTSCSGRSCAGSMSHWSAEHVAPSSEDDVERQFGIDRGRGGDPVPDRPAQ